MVNAKMYCDVLVGCGTHDKKRTYKKPVWPRTKCEVCYLVALSDQLETSLYQDDMERILKFAGKSPKINYEETSDDKEA